MRVVGHAIKRRSFSSRFMVPAGSMLLLLAALLLIYNNAWRIDSPGLKALLASASGVPLFWLLYFSAVVVYPLVYFQGGKTWERIAASFVPQAAWWLKEMYLAGAYFTFAETLYYGLSPVFLVAFAGNVAVMGAAELVCRILAGRRGVRVRVLTPGPVAAIVIGLAGVFFMALYGGGEPSFYLYQEGYKALFH
jgi:hypothetical protein